MNKIDYKALFGSEGLCECNHCRSVYSPASYLVDVLQNAIPSEARGALLDSKRRPDLGQIELSCKNTETPLPYVDLVNEVLEDYISPRSFTIPLSYQGELDTKALSDKLRGEFASHEAPLSTAASVSWVKKGERWSITDTGWNFGISPEAGQLKVFPVPQTSGTAAELSANPEHVNDGAYRKLSRALYAWDLPFNLPVEEARRLLDHLGVPRVELMRRFQREPVATGLPLEPSALAIADESLGLTSFERQIVTGGLHVRAASTAALNTSGIMTVDGVVLGESHYVLVKDQANPEENGVYVVNDSGPWERAGERNPDARIENSLLVFVEKGTQNSESHWQLVNDSGRFFVRKVDPWDFWGLQETNNKIPDPKDNTKTVDLWLDVLNIVSWFLKKAGISYQELVDVLSTNYINPDKKNLAFIIQFEDDKCDLDRASFQKPLDAIVGARLHRLLRLQRKLGWTVRDLDKLLSALKAPDITDECILQLSYIREFQARFKLSLTDILSWWSNIDTAEGDQGTKSLYDEHFQNKAVQKLEKNDTFALNEDRTELRIPGKIRDHVPGVIAGLEISTADLSLLINDSGIIPQIPDPADPEPDPTKRRRVPDDKLNLDNLSRLYRHTTLARVLGLSIREFLSVKALSGINPFDPSRMSELSRLADIVEKVRTSGFSLEELNYLYRDIWERSSGVAPVQDSIVSLAKALREGLKKIADDNKLVPDPDGELLRKKLGTLWKAEVVDQMIGMINGSAVYVAPLDKLPNIKFSDAIADRISYDPDAKALRFIGPMTLTDKNALNLLPGDTLYQSAVEDLYQQPRSFLNDTTPGFLPKNAVDHLLDKVPLPPNAQPPTVEEKFAYVLQSLLPYLEKFQSRSFIKQVMADTLKLDPQTVELLLESILKPALNDLLATAGEGLSADYFDDKDLEMNTAAAKAVRIDPIVDFNWNRKAPDPNLKLTAFSARWIAWLIAQYTEPYSFYVRADNGVRLWLNNQLVIDQWKDQPIAEHESGNKTQLRAGQLYEIRLEYYHKDYQTANGGEGEAGATLLWSSSSTPKASVPQTNLFPAGPLASFRESFRRLHKAAMLINGLKLTTKELDYVSEHSADFGGFDLNALPLEPAKFSPAQFLQWERLYDLVTLRRSLPRRAGDLAAVFGAATLEDSIVALAAATNWDATTLNQLAGAEGFDLKPDALKNEIWPLKLKACFRIIKRLGVSASTLFSWASKEPDAEQARQLKSAARAKYDQHQWLNVAKPLQDTLREKKRAALVSCIMSQDMTGKFADANDLFDHFLIDVEMSPCMITSRLKQAMSSVQLFVQRVLMNLEDNLSLAERDSRHWTTWMKNYRAWEANRKVFLYPENWIEPELRDDKTPFFKELENELLQKEVTMDSAEDAFLHYLEKLDAVARLEIAGMYHQKEYERGKATVDILHVFGRTWSTPHIHYYRQRKRDDTSVVWTPWEKVDLDIQGDHLVPIVWNRRLHLFWPLFTEKAEQTEQERQANQDPRKHLEIQIAWSEYRNHKWSPKKMAVNDFLRGPDDSVSRNALDRSKYLFKGAIDPSEDLLVHCLFDDPGSISYALAQVPDSASVGRSPGGGGPVGGGTPQPAARVGDITGTGASDGNRAGGQGTGGTGGLWKGSFRFLGCGGAPLVEGESLGFNHGRGLIFKHGFLFTPERSTINYMTFKEIEPSQTSDDDDSLSIVEEDKISRPVLENTPGNFRLLYPHQFSQFTSQDELFFEDDKKTFLVTPAGELDAPQIVASFTPGSINLTGGSKFTKITPGSIGAFKKAIPYEIARAGTRHGPGIVDEGLRNTPGPLNAPAAGANLPQGNFSYSFARERYSFQVFYHPYVCNAIRRLNQHGIEGLLNWPMEQEPNSNPSHPTNFDVDFFDTRYHPLSRAVVKPSPHETLDFSLEGMTPYSQYNWELFFHAPLIIADRLSKNQKFNEAQKWFHYIFDPTNRSSYQAPHRARVWKMRRFYDDMVRLDPDPPQTLQALMAKAQAPEFQNAVTQWRDNPFNPHLLARGRLVAYQKTVVMKYLDNLIGWADQLFRRETIESINEATQLYVLAAELLGKRPETIPPPVRTSDQVTYGDLEIGLDVFGNELVKIEHLVSAGQNGSPSSNTGWEVVKSLAQQAQLFCIPGNEKLLSYWDTVADRLFKIRHCLNIEGVEIQLPLFEPPIDPALLVRAAAAGLDLGAVLNQLSAPLPHYRFGAMVQKALEFCAEVKALGAALLSALEKRDAETLAQLRSSHEIDLLTAVREVKLKQVEEAKATWEGLQRYQDVVDGRKKYYADRLKQKINPHEQAHLNLLSATSYLQESQAGLELAASIVHLIPMTKAGAPTTIGASYGGRNIAGFIQAFAQSLGNIAAALSSQGSMSVTSAGYDRRADEWTFQANQATRELEQVKKQIAAADIRAAITEKELENHDRQVNQAKEIGDYLHDKFTNEDLYNWMVGQISAVYFPSYQLAVDLGKKAERAFQFELAEPNKSFIQFGYWDSLNKGLLAGEKLHYDLKRMEAAYLESNKREYELTKHVSLAALDPLALISLKDTGQCFIKLPEVLFDLDYPGHYLRRIKSISVTIPCVAGPYTTVGCTLTLLKNSIRTKIIPADGPYQRKGDEDPRFSDNIGAVQSIVTSTAQNDSGMWEPNLRDERFLPFEGRGVISEWRIELSGRWQDADGNKVEFPQFDFKTVSDLVLHVRFTAREGGKALRSQVLKEIQTGLNSLTSLPEGHGLTRVFSVRHEFSSEWHRFLNNYTLEADPADPQNGNLLQTLVLDLAEDLFPFAFRDRIELQRLWLLLKPKQGKHEDGITLQVKLVPPPQVEVLPPEGSSSTSSSSTMTLETGSLVPGLAAGKSILKKLGGATGFGEWTLQVRAKDNIADLPEDLRKGVFIDSNIHAGDPDYWRLNPKGLEDLHILCEYILRS